jgi:hypothetical protein
MRSKRFFHVYLWSSFDDGDMVVICLIDFVDNVAFFEFFQRKHGIGWSHFPPKTSPTRQFLLHLERIILYLYLHCLSPGIEREELFLLRYDCYGFTFESIVLV